MTLVSLGVLGGVVGLFFRSDLARKTKDIIKSFLHLLKPAADLPQGGALTSVETALNSRCTSDYDGNPERSHWGMFSRTKKLSQEQIKRIVDLARIPRFTDQKVEIQFEQNMLTFVVENRVSGVLKDWIMVESGMQQQAVGLVCAALGVGMVFRNLGKDGTSISNTDFRTIKIKLGSMKPAYNGSFWSNLTPAGSNLWQKGNLPNPVRDGGKPLLATIANLGIHNRGCRNSTDQSISQLLWAARGRTPHFYMSKPWGMTIPTWAGQQNISSVYLYKENKLYKYINWAYEKPTHSLKELNQVDEHHLNKIKKLFSPNNAFIILRANEKFARSLWEIGYQLLNLMLQAKTLDIYYSALLLDENQKSRVESLGFEDPVAILAI